MWGLGSRQGKSKCGGCDAVACLERSSAGQLVGAGGGVEGNGEPIV